VSQKPLVGSVVFQATGVAEAPRSGVSASLSGWPAGTRGCQQDAGAPWGLGV